MNHIPSTNTSLSSTSTSTSSATTTTTKEYTNDVDNYSEIDGCVSRVSTTMFDPMMTILNHTTNRNNRYDDNSNSITNVASSSPGLIAATRSITAASIRTTNNDEFDGHYHHRRYETKKITKNFNTINDYDYDNDYKSNRNNNNNPRQLSLSLSLSSSSPSSLQNGHENGNDSNGNDDDDGSSNQQDRERLLSSSRFQKSLPIAASHRRKSQQQKGGSFNNNNSSNSNSNDNENISEYIPTATSSPSSSLVRRHESMTSSSLESVLEENRSESDDDCNGDVEDSTDDQTMSEEYGGDCSCYESQTETDAFYLDDDEEEDDYDELESEHANVIAIGVLDEKESEDEEAKADQMQQQQQHFQNSLFPHSNRGAVNNNERQTDIRGLHCQQQQQQKSSDEVVAKDIAQEEHNIKMKIKMAATNNTTSVRRRAVVPMNRLRANDGQDNLKKSISNGEDSNTTSSAVLADIDRQEKMRTVRGARDGVIVPRLRTPRRLHSRTSSYTAPPRQPVRNLSNHGEDKSSPLAVVAATTTTPQKKKAGEINKQKNSSNTKVKFATDKNKDKNDGADADENDGNDDDDNYRSTGIDLDDKTRQRILTRSTLVHARKPIRSLGGDGGGGAARSTIAAVAVASASANGNNQVGVIPSTTSSSRPSDDKRNMRISPKISALSSSPSLPRASSSVFSTPPNNTTSLPTRPDRPSDEKAMFRRQPPSATLSSTGSVARSSVHTSNSNTDIGFGGSNEDASIDISRSNSLNTAEDTRQVEDLEAQSDDHDIVLLPGAFAIDGIGDEQGQVQNEGVSGYDSGFEDDDTVVEDSDIVEVLSEQEPENPEAIPRDCVSVLATTAITSTPLLAELYEVEAAVAAEVLIEEEEEDPNGKGSFRTLSIQISVALFVLLLIAGIVMGVVIPRVGNKNDDSNGNPNDQDDTPIVEGWIQVGEILTVEDAYKDNIRFGNAVALSSDGDRIAVGLPGSDDLRNDRMKSTGSVQIFDLMNGTIWEEIFQTFGTHSNAELGTNVAISKDGKRVAVGAPSYDSKETGYVSIYQESEENGTWNLISNITSNNETNGDIFGDAVGFSGDGSIVAVADKYADRVDEDIEDAGAVQIYQEVNGTWKPMGTPLFGSEKRDLFGWSVALSRDGSRVAASSLGSNEKPGNIRTFDFNRELRDWEEVSSNLVGESTRESFGVSVKLSDDGSILTVGAPGYSRDGQEASVGIVRSYQFDEAQGEWSPYGQPLEGANAFDAFGSSVALNSAGDIVAIGAPENGSFCDNCGHIQVFENQNGTWNDIGSSIGISDINSGQFGYSVALSGTGGRLVGAAPFTIQNGFVSKVGEVIVFDSITNVTVDGSIV